MTRHWTSRTIVALAVAAALATGCGSDGTGPQDTSTMCTITLSGAVTGTPACGGVTADETTSDGNSSVGLDGTGAGDTLSVAVWFSGAPTVHTYRSGVDAHPTMLLTNGSAIWVTDDADGSLTLDITSVKSLDSGAGITSYEVHGSLTATMVAEVSNGSIGPVTVTVTF
jgi:hypothetical protein